MKDPPKKKHPKKARPEPVVPLTDAERRGKAELEFEKALRFLDEAKKLAAWGGAPHACVHSAYYAINHCAAAAILTSGGVGKHLDSPKSHETLIVHFAKLVDGETEALRECGKILSRAHSDRIASDYGLQETVSSQDAASSAIDATTFIEVCQAKWKLYGPKPS